MKSILDKTKRYYRKYGILRLIKKIILNICSLLFSYKPLNVYSISGLPRTELKPSCPLEIRRGGPEDIGLIVCLLDYLSEEVAREREKYLFDNGGEVFLAFSKGKLVHMAWWFYYPGIHEANFFVKLKSDEAYASSGYTHPEFRGKNIYPVVLQHVVKYMVDKNIKRCFGAITPSNVASIKGIEKAGFSFVGKKQKFRLFGKMFNNQWVSSKSDNFH